LLITLIIIANRDISQKKIQNDRIFYTENKLNFPTQKHIEQLELIWVKNLYAFGKWGMEN